jgi:hypothetical protein
MRPAGLKKEIEAEFGVDEKEGTLVLTNKRLVFVCTNQLEEDLSAAGGLEAAVEEPIEDLDRSGKVRGAKIALLYSEVEDLGAVPNAAPNLFIPIESISSAQGHKGGLGRPSLEVDWTDEGGKHGRVFTEMLTGRRRRNLDDWAVAIQNLKAGKQKLVSLPPAPSSDTLEGRIMRVLSDMQEKGVLTIEEQVETEFRVDTDPDAVQAACDKLASQGLLKRYPDPSGDVYYRRISPLGEEDLSS